MFLLQSKTDNLHFLNKIQWHVAAKKKCKGRQHLVFNLTRHKECSVIAFRFNNRIIAISFILALRDLSSAILMKKKKKKNCKKRNWTDIWFHFTYFHDKRKPRNPRHIKIPDIIVLKKCARLKSADYEYLFSKILF